MRDYATTGLMDAWLRHPVMGDPSFDTFERLGDTVHRSEPPYEWGVNGSLYRDFDGTWYYYAGLYLYGYRADPELRSRFRIYRSCDEGMHWEDLGWGFEEGFCFEGEEVPSDSCPDVVMCYDELHKKYLLTYDTSTNNFRWDTAHTNEIKVRSGAALAWADTPAGPFTRIPTRIFTNVDIYGLSGRWDRLYGCTVFPRKNDYIAFILCDSDQHFAWALTVMTAPSPEGPWSRPNMVLCCDTPGYYPCPLEFHPVELVDGMVYASATSVAANRNYQGIFCAPLEEAHEASKWKLTADGNVWHAHDHPDEYYGIWGQTFHGFVEPDTGRYVVMFPSKDARDYGMLSVASRPWNQPHSDGFTMSGHEGPSISVILESYKDFTLDVSFEARGNVAFAFDYDGLLGPDDSCADSVPAPSALAGYCAVRVCEDRCMLVKVAKDGTETVFRETALADAALEEESCSAGVLKRKFGGQLAMKVQEGSVTVYFNHTLLFENVKIPGSIRAARPLALIVDKFSRITCSQFAVEGEAGPYDIAYNAVDALLGAGQLRPEKKNVALEEALVPDVWHRIPDGYVGEGRIAAKWNVIGSSFKIPFVSAPFLGKAGIWVDGNFSGAADLSKEGAASWEIENLEMGRHAIRVEPLEGRIAITKLFVSGEMETEKEAD